MTTQTRIGLVGCGSTKLPEPAPARSLYTGGLFRKAAAYAEATCDRWYVLSAKHGLVHPETVIAPYDVKLGRSHFDPEKDAPPTWTWRARVLDALKVELADVPNPHLVVLAGETYRVILHWSEWTSEVPMKGLGIGQQLAWLNANTPQKPDAGETGPTTTC
jgi:cytoplasmic iron level regulating protein YaaA (DUF328/UPF0246 family)